MIDYAIIDGQPANPPYPVDCYLCKEQFDAGHAAWCQCDNKVSTLICPNCQTCFCLAPVLYKQRFWRDAPQSLGESTSRFRIGDGSRAKPVTAGAGVHSRQPRVLIVDDEEDMRSLVACYVEQMGYDVTTTTSPVDALTILESASFEVMITDALMPGMDGRELCRRAKNTYGNAMKVVLMTSLYTASRFKTEARHRFGVDEYLTKPLQFGVLKSALDRVAPIGNEVS